MIRAFIFEGCFPKFLKANHAMDDFIGKRPCGKEVTY